MSFFIQGFMATTLEVFKGLNSLGFAGRVGYVCGLSVWTLLCLPTTPVELAAGLSFPLVTCTAMSATGKTIGSLLALLLGRRLLKPLISRYLAAEGGGGALHRSVLRVASWQGHRPAAWPPRTNPPGAWLQVSVRGCGTTVQRMPNACDFARSPPRHRHLLRELREHPLQTMSLLRAAPLPTPLKIYGLSLFPAELIPLTSYAGIAITFNLLPRRRPQRARPGSDSAGNLPPEAPTRWHTAPPLGS